VPFGPAPVGSVSGPSRTGVTMLTLPFSIALVYVKILNR